MIGPRSGPALPDFPWDHLEPLRERAAEHPDGLIDLSVGTPVDPTPRIAQEALAAASNAPGYPPTHGTPQLRAAARDYLSRRFGAVEVEPDAVLPTLGAKELVAWLPTLLGLGPADVVVVPEIAYPTYAVGAQLAGCQVLATDVPHKPTEPASTPTGGGPEGARIGLLWLNSPANPSGRIRSAGELAELVGWARAHRIPVASDECYLEFAWDDEPVSILHPGVNGGTLDGLLAVHSLSKRSNLAGYRAGFVAGDPAHVKQLLAVRKHLGMMVPRPVQDVMTAVLADDSHVDEQRTRYRDRRARLRPALTAAGFTIDHSEGSLYLWATRGEPGWETVRWCADRGILVTPGDFYGPAGARHVRVALTATDEAVAAATARLSRP